MRRYVIALLCVLLVYGIAAGRDDERRAIRESAGGGGEETDGIDAFIWEPDQINDQVAFFHVDSALYENGITITNVQISLDEDIAYTMTFEEWAGDPRAKENDIEAVTTGATDDYMEVTDSDIDDADIDADDWVYLNIPSTDTPWVHVKIIFTVN